MEAQKKLSNGNPISMKSFFGLENTCSGHQCMGLRLSHIYYYMTVCRHGWRNSRNSISTRVFLTFQRRLLGALSLDSDEGGSEHITRDISAHHPAMYGADPIKHDTDSNSDQYWYEAGFECNSAYKAPLMDPDCFNMHQFLRDIVLSCTSDGVEEASAAFHQCQAVYQFSKYKDELL